MNKTIMLVDDSAALRQVLSTALAGAGYDVVQASDGQEALAKLDGRKLHLIISDINMPNMDGISFVRAAKRLPAYQYTPVVMLTTAADEATHQLGREAGAKAWVYKPFQPTQMLNAVARLILP